MPKHVIAYEDTTGIVEFDRLSEVRYVYQNGGIVPSTVPVLTEGVARGSVLLLKNLRTGDSVFLHLDQYSIHDFSKDLGDYVRAFLDFPGDKKGLMISSAGSYRRDSIVTALKSKGVDFMEPVLINTYSYYASVAFRPLTNEILCLNPDEKTVTIYSCDELISEAIAAADTSSKTLAKLVEEKIHLKTMVREFERKMSVPGEPVDTLLAYISDISTIPPLMEGSDLSRIIQDHLERICFHIGYVADESLSSNQFIKLAIIINQYIKKYADFPLQIKGFYNVYRLLLKALSDDIKDGLSISKEELMFFVRTNTEISDAFPAFSGKLSFFSQKFQDIIDLKRSTEHPSGSLHLGLS